MLYEVVNSYVIIVNSDLHRNVLCIVAFNGFFRWIGDYMNLKIKPANAPVLFGYADRRFRPRPLHLSFYSNWSDEMFMLISRQTLHLTLSTLLKNAEQRQPPSISYLFIHLSSPSHIYSHILALLRSRLLHKLIVK